MPRRHSWLCLLVIFSALAPFSVVAEEPAGKWKPLLDEKFSAWDLKSSSPAEEWKFDKEVMSTTAGGGGWLKTRDTYQDFELQLEFRMQPGANSGVFLRADGSVPHVDGLEVQLLDDEAFPSGSASTACAALMLEAGPSKRVAKKSGEWQTLYIKCQGAKVQVKLNGELVIDEDLALHPERAEKHPGRKSEKGRIGLQNRGEIVDFRKLEVRELK